MIRDISTVIILIAALASAVHAQQKPDFSGIWALDPDRSDDDHVYGQMRVISQTPTHIEMAVLHFAAGQTSITPWELPFDRWRPRRGGKRSLEPVVQSRWDGTRLVTVKAPGTSYSVLWIWSLSDNGMTLTVDTVSTSISPSFDFTVASAPRGFIPDRHIYTRVAMPEERSFALGDAAIRFGREPRSLGITCAVRSCTLTDVVAGRRQQSRTIANGREAIVSLQTLTLIAATRD